VVREGDRVAATGRLVRNEMGDWFEPAMWIAEPGGMERRVRPVWRGAVRVAGADFDAVARRFEQDGLVEGWAAVTGTWSGEQLRAERQDPPVRTPAAHARWAAPPCPPPPGGWPVTGRHGDVELSYDLGDLAETGAATAITLFHPGPDQAVLVIAAADPAAVEARLRPQLGASLCVVPSRWTSSTPSAATWASAGSSGTSSSSDPGTARTASPVSLPASPGFSRRSRPGQPHCPRASWRSNHG
jgi:hypothetical protein